ncbi:MAG: hypothetical protein ABW022_06885, partial [Actinoplanes sp.]
MTATVSGAGGAGRARPLRVLLADAAPMQRSGLRAVLTAASATPAASGATSGDPATPATHDSIGNSAAGAAGRNAHIGSAVDTAAHDANARAR